MQAPIPIIGIIGPPCSGKSTVARILQSLGGHWIDADRIAKAQLDVPEVVSELVGLFGNSILLTGDSDAVGYVSRPAIADLVFGQDDASQARLKQLESVIHPRTRSAIEQSIRLVETSVEESAANLFVVLDVPLLIESGWTDRCTEVWCLKISPQRQATLLDARGWDVDELARRERRQIPWSEKQRHATWVIENNGSVEELQAKVTERLRKLML